MVFLLLYLSTYLMSYTLSCSIPKTMILLFFSSFCFTVKQVKKELLANSKLCIVNREFTQHDRA